MSPYTGDELYPETPDLDGVNAYRVMEQSTKELNRSASAMNRTYRDEDGVWKTKCTIPAICGMIAPVQDIKPSAL